MKTQSIYYPTISLIIVAKNSINTIDKALNSLLEQTYPQELCEYIFVDSMSTDGTQEFLQNKILELQQLGLKAKFLLNTKKILSSGWNLALKNSSSELVCRIDAHSIIDKNYIKLGVETLLKSSANVVGIGGIVIDYLYHNFQGQIIANICKCPFGIGWSPFRIKIKDVCYFSDTAVFAIYKKEILLKHGLFSENLERNQDINLHTKLRDKGFKFMTNPKMYAKIYVNNNIFDKLIIKAFKEGFWIPFAYDGFKFFYCSSSISSLRHWVPLFFYIYICMLIGGAFIYPKRLLFYFPLFLYFLLAFYFTFKGTQDQSVIGIKIILPFFFFVYHFSYGVGTFCGLCVFIYKSIVYRIK